MLGATLTCLLVLASVTCGSPVVGDKAQGDRHTVRKRVSNLPLIAGDDDVASLQMLKNQPKFDPKKQNIEVKLIEAWGPDHPYPRKQLDHQQQKKRLSPGVQSFSSAHSSSSQYSNLNGNVVAKTDQKERAVENGELVAAFHRAANLKQAAPGQQPKVQELTELDIPEENIHKKVLNNNGRAVQYNSPNSLAAQQMSGSASKRSQVDPGLAATFNQLAMADPVAMRKRVQDDKLATAEELSKYILETGDEQGVANYFQDLLLDGQLGEYEVLDYLNLIKSLLTVEKESEIEMEREEEREREAQMILDFSDYLDSKYQNGEIPSNLYRGLKGKLMESVIERAASDPQFLAEPLARRR